MRYLPAIYGAMHRLVDATTLTVRFSAVAVHGLDPASAFALVLAYDLIAFASQAAFGLAADALRAPRGATLLGIALAAASALALSVDATIAMVLAGTGNALFHVGAGVLSLHARPGRAVDAGVFVAPGALGLALGMWLGKPAAVGVWALLALIFLVRRRSRVGMTG